MKRSSRLGPSGPRCEAGRFAGGPAICTPPRKAAGAMYCRARDPGRRRAGLAGLVPDRPAPQCQQQRRVPPERAVRRGWLLLKTFPEVVPGTTFRESFLGNGLKELSHVENLPQRVPILLTAGLIAAAAIGLGDMVLRGLKLEAGLGAAERIALDYGLGAGLLGVADVAAGTAGLARIRWLFRAGARVARRRGPGDLPALACGPIQAEFIVLLAGDRDRPVRGGDDPGLDAAFDRLRRPRISPRKGPRSITRPGASPSCRTTFTRACRSASRCSTWRRWR